MITTLQLIPPTVLTAAAAAHLTAPADTTYRIGRAGFSNPNAAAIAVTAYLVGTGGRPSAANQIVNAVLVASGSTYVSPELAGLVLAPGSALQCFGLGIVLYASGVSIT